MNNKKINKKKHILQITPFFYPNVGGVETHLNDLLEYLDNLGYKNTVITYQALAGNNKGDNYEIYKGAEIIRLSWIRGLYYKTLHSPILHFLYLTPWITINSFIYLIKNPKVEIIQAHGINAGIAGAVLKIIFQKPLITTIHVETNFLQNNLSTKIQLWPLKMSDKILVVTERTKNNLTKLGIDRNKISVFSYWVNKKIFKKMNKTAQRKILGLPSDNLIILFVGRITAEKGIMTVLEVAKKLNLITFVIIGSGDLKNIVEEQSKKIANIKFIGRVENKNLPGYYNSADFLLIPSLVKKPRPIYEESIPRVIVESLTCGTPILGTDNGGIKETVEKGDVGVVISDKVSSLVKTIQNTVNNKNKRDYWSKKTLEYASDRFSKQKAKIITDAYEDVKSRFK